MLKSLKNINRTYLLILFFLIIGVLYRFVLTSGNNFIFNMDNARDMVDIREIVVLGKSRLIGNTAAIEGVYYGPFWYYLSAIPFVISKGDPYAAIILQIILWAIGGFFALKLVGRYGLLPMILVGSVWVASNFVVLSSSYAFNPNPTLFLTPLFIFLFEKYLVTKKTIFAVSSFALAGTFFSSEIFFAVFVPLIIILAILITKNTKLFRSRSFWFGVVGFLIVISPQVLFDIRHNFLMSKSLIAYLSSGSADAQTVGMFKRIEIVFNAFYGIMLPTFMNFNLFTIFIGLFTAPVLFLIFKMGRLRSDFLLVITLLYIVIPLIGFTLVPVAINSWHWVGVVAALVVLSGIIVGWGARLGIFTKIASLTLIILIVSFSIFNVTEYLKAKNLRNNDPSQFGNELAAVDFVYQKAQGKNFKVYVYMPSVIDYPYQYLFWWRGLGKYGYVPEDYAYEPNKPEYIHNKEALSKGDQPTSSGLIFLVMEPDRINRREEWLDHFKMHPLISVDKVGPIIIQTRSEIKKQ